MARSRCDSTLALEVRSRNTQNEVNHAHGLIKLPRRKRVAYKKTSGTQGIVIQVIK